jgi:hypothetical protein
MKEEDKVLEEMMEWFFRKLEPGESTRDSTSGAFFTINAIKDPSEAMVREGIQNALDARDGRSKVRIRICIDAMNSNDKRIEKWFEGLWDHIKSSESGLKDVPKDPKECTFLVFEDFGTKGLEGDEKQAFDEPNIPNSFFYFFRAEGRSGKCETDRGRWGIGKYVFLRPSRIGTFFGFSVRKNDKRHLLMGRTIIRTHKLNGNHFSPDGYMGIKDKNNSMMYPIENEKTIQEFCSDFQILRKNESGLSILIPYVEEEITINSLIEAVIRSYFYPIFQDHLEVVIESANNRIGIDSISINRLVNDFDNLRYFQPFIELAEWAIKKSSDETIQLNECLLEKPTWSKDLISEENIGLLKSKLKGNEKIAIHMPHQK